MLVPGRTVHGNQTVPAEIYVLVYGYLVNGFLLWKPTRRLAGQPLRVLELDHVILRAGHWFYGIWCDYVGHDQENQILDARRQISCVSGIYSRKKPPVLAGGFNLILVAGISSSVR